ncbi:GNAT family N-acetyltransferase [Pseudomonas sp. MWU15-20650]|uniref:GNAT family N-acetyltransferase n=1 Tax=Pseudomonas sp. MWU15-20650 TaxID=2933107 RepID=UPI00200DFD06|nr:GNAT family N-acetyltransferase [Pseudomonas sp. MWU15-20650]
MINLRKATHSDLKALHEVGCETYRQHFSMLWSPAAMQDFLDQDFSPSALSQSLELPTRHLWLLAAEGSGQVIGFAKVNWSTPAPLTGVVGAELQKIYLLKSASGRGYGRQLLQFIRDEATARGEHLLWLDVLKNNADAQRFYEAFGFQRIGEIPFNTDLAEIGMVVMGLELQQTIAC